MPKFPAHPERRAAVVTGASSGHGLAIAQALATLELADTLGVDLPLARQSLHDFARGLGVPRVH